MRRLRWKSPWHYIIVLCEGYIAGYFLTRSVITYPDDDWMLFLALSFVAFLVWLFTDVQPAP